MQVDGRLDLRATIVIEQHSEIVLGGRRDQRVIVGDSCDRSRFQTLASMLGARECSLSRQGQGQPQRLPLAVWSCWPCVWARRLRWLLFNPRIHRPRAVYSRFTLPQWPKLSQAQLIMNVLGRGRPTIPALPQQSNSRKTQNASSKSQSWW